MPRRSPVLLAAAFSILAGSAHAQKSEVRLGFSVVPTHQAIEVRLDPREAAYTGSVEISLDVREETGRVRLHCAETEITAARVVRDGARIDVTHEREADDVIVLTIDPPLAPGSCVLTLA